MSLVTVQRSPESASTQTPKTNDEILHHKLIANSTSKLSSKANRFSLNLSRANSNNLPNDSTNYQSATSLSSLSFRDSKNTTSSLLGTKKKNGQDGTPKRSSFNLDERPLTYSNNFENLKALYSSSSLFTSTDKSEKQNFNRTSVNSNTIPYVNRKNAKNSTVFNRLSLNLNEKQMSKSAEIRKTTLKEDDDVIKTLKPLESNLILRSSRNLIEKYFVVKDAALILPKRSASNQIVNNKNSNENLSNCSTLKRPSSLLIQKIEEPPASLELSASLNSSSNLNTSVTSSTGDILVHLQSMISLLRPNDTIILAVKLFSYVQERIRYLVIVETQSSNKNCEFLSEESAILGLDLSQIAQTETITSEKEEDKEKTVTKSFMCTVGLVLPIYANCEISLDGDGGFKFKSHQSTHIFKPVSIQAMWSAYQYLHKAFENARKCNFYSIQSSGSSSSSSSSNSPLFNNPNNPMDFSINSLACEQSATETLQQAENHDWIKYYSSLIGKNKLEQQCINEWYQKEERSAQREDFTTPYFDSLQLCKEQEETGLKIKEKLKEIMMSSKDDYGSMSSIYIREILEKELQLNLDGFKRFIDATIFQFYNQLVECATKILPYLYLGSEWNASNYDSLVNDRVTHILNVSSEVDNFFPDTFKYLNIRVLDIDETDLLKEFDRTNKFIQEAKEQNTSCLVHCKMGVSRSASVVIAYLMKELCYTYEQAFSFSKQKRACINPNDSFKQQLITYESILNAHRAKYNLFEPSPQSSTTSILNTNQEDLEVINQTGLSVKDAVNKIKSMSSIDQLNATSQSSQPPLSPNNTKKQQANNLTVNLLASNTSPPFVSRKVLSLSPTNLNENASQLNETPKLTIRSVKSTNSDNLDQNFDFPNEYLLKHAQSCPNQMTNCSRNSTLVKKLAKELDTQAPSDTNYYDPILDSTYSSNHVSSINFTLSTENIEDSSSTTFEYSYVPIGTVKRQVESINIKSKPIEYGLIRQSTIDFDTKGNLDQEAKALQQATTSPDSKRFKCELLQLENSELEKAESCLENLEDDELGVLSRQSEFNRSKKLFEQLELQRTNDSFKTRKEEASSFKNANRQSKLNATIS